jgi:membrane-associated phospholipid phosphatase
VVRGALLIHPETEQGTGLAADRRQPGTAETLVGAALLVVSFVGAAIAAGHPGENTFDAWGFSTIDHARRSTVLLRITELASPVILVVATLLAGVVAVRHDRLRAVACVAGPAAVALLVELVIKPVVGRRFEGVLTYPSGNVADVAAVATAWSLAVMSRLRPAVAIVGAVVTAAMVYAVIGLRWHYPSDAVGGVVLGVAVVVFLDGVLHLRRGGAPA